MIKPQITDRLDLVVQIHLSLLHLVSNDEIAAGLGIKSLGRSDVAFDASSFNSSRILSFISSILPF